MINGNILHDKLMDKFMTIAFNSIVTECFIKGLPIEAKFMDQEENTRLKNYMSSVIESLGGIRLLDNAIENPNITESQREFLLNLYSICNESADAATTRIERETDCKKEEKLDDVLDRAEFTKEEYDEFIKKAGDLGIDEISEIIKEKTIQALIDERDAYEKEEQLEEELKNQLANSKDFANESVNSYLNIILEKDAPRHYVSLLSKMQSRAMDALNRLTDLNDKYSYFDALNNFTFESFLPDLKKAKPITEALESVIRLQEMLTNKKAANESLIDIDDPNQYRIKLAMLISTIAYTAMESLKTLNLYSPSKDIIKKYVGSHDISLENALEAEAYDVIEKTAEVVDDAANTDYSKTPVEELTVIVDRLTRIKELLEIITLNNADFLSSRTEILNSLSNTLIKISKIIAKYQTTEKEDDDSYYGKLKKENDIAQLNKIDMLFSKNPNVHEILLMVDPKSTTPVINVSAVDKIKKVVGSSYIILSNKLEPNKMIDYIKRIFGESKLGASPKVVSIYMADGSAKKIQLK